MCRQNHSYAVDYYAVGVIVYECMFGRRPYVGRSRKEIRDQILSKQVKIKFEQVPNGCYKVFKSYKKIKPQN